MACDARAHITGTVWQIRVQPGEVVALDQELLVLESMKMEMPVVAPCAGKVALIHVAEGQAVAEGDLLVSLDEVS